MPNQANIILGDNITIYLAKGFRKNPSDLKPLAFSTNLDVELANSLVPTDNKDTLLAQTFKKVSHALNITANVIQRDWSAEREQITEFKGVDPNNANIPVSQDTSTNEAGIKLNTASSHVPNTYVGRVVEFGNTGISGKLKSVSSSGTKEIVIEGLFSAKDVIAFRKETTLYALEPNADRLTRRTTYDLNYYHVNELPVQFEFGTAGERVFGQGHINTVSYMSESHALATANITIQSSGVFEYIDDSEFAVLLGFGTTLNIARSSYNSSPKTYYVKDNTKSIFADGNTIYTDSAKTTEAPAGFYYDGYLSIEVT